MRNVYLANSELRDSWLANPEHLSHPSPMPIAPLLPVLPSGALPPAAFLLRWLEALQTDQVDTVVTGGLPPLNGSLPDLLRLGGIDRLLASGMPRLAFRWEGHGGSRITVCEASADEDALDLHHGDLPDASTTVGTDEAISALIDLARLQDANALLGLGHGADWPALLPLVDRDRIPRLPPSLLIPAMADHETGVWNPLPFAREALVELSATKRPWGFRDAHGRRVPAQVVDDGTDQFVLTSLPLGALEATPLHELDDPPVDAAWEVDVSVIDNGVVRAEFDDQGQVIRLCCRGVFAEPAAPLVQPYLDDLPMGGTATITVIETGPVRARVRVVRTAADGTLTVTYDLHVHEDGLRITAVWAGAGELTLGHPTNHRAATCHLAGELARCDQPQAESILHPPMAPTAGVRWAALADPAGRGLAVVAPRPLRLSAHGGNLRIAVLGTTDYALTSATRHDDTLSLGHLAQHLAMPARPFVGATAIPAPFRLAGSARLVPLWIRRPSDWSGELLLADQGNARGRAWLYPIAPVREAWRVDASGQGRMPVPLTREKDGIEIDHAAGEVVVVRWR